MTVHVGLNVVAIVWETATGRVLQRQRMTNAVVNAGLNLLRDLLNNDAVNGLTHFATGTGNSTVTAIQTTLDTEVFRDILTGSTKTLGKLTVDYYLAEGSANGNLLSEAGLFNAAAAGTMYARVVFPTPIAKTASLAVTFSWELTWSIA